MTLPADGADSSQYEKLKGNRIGSGQQRNVFEVIGHEDVVLKIQKDPNVSVNKAEYKIYHKVNENHPVAINTIAKIYGISDDGMYLLMEKLDTGNISDGSTFKIMKEVSDRKKENFGKDTQGVIKCLDYNSLKFTSDGKVTMIADITGEVEEWGFTSDYNETWSL